MADLIDLQRRAKAVNDIYVETFGLERDAFMLLGKMTEEMGEVMGAYLQMAGRARGADGDPAELKSALEDEMADLFGFLLVFADTQGVDLAAAFDKKWGKYLEPDA
jgi:NTP pyrophosphatase (non-canonical NTP hydrolase)